MKNREERKFLIYLTSIFFLAVLILTGGILLYYYIHIVIFRECGRGSFRDFIINLFLWEMAFILSISYIFYLLFKAYVQQRQQVEEIFQILLQAISHRFGNFLSTQKINLLLLKEGHRDYVLERIDASISSFENDFQQIINILKNFDGRKMSFDFVNISHIIKELWEENREKELKLCMSGKEIKVKGPLLLLRTLLSLLLENTFKYAQSKIYIRTGHYNKRPYFYLANDLKENISPGTGLGLKIVHMLAEKLKIEIRSKKDTKYKIILFWPPRG